MVGTGVEAMGTGVETSVKSSAAEHVCAARPCTTGTHYLQRGGCPLQPLPTQAQTSCGQRIGQPIGQRSVITYARLMHV